MSRKSWSILIGIVVVVGVFAAIKLMPLYATLVALGTFAFGCFTGYILKKKEIIEKIVEKPVEVIKTITKEVPVEVEKIVYRDSPSESKECEPDCAEVTHEEVQPKAKKRNRSKKVAQ